MTGETFTDGIERTGHVRCVLCKQGGTVTLNADVPITAEMFTANGWMRAQDTATGVMGWICPGCTGRYVQKNQTTLTLRPYVWQNQQAKESYEQLHRDGNQQ